MTTYKLEKLPPEYFTWSRWRACNIFEKLQVPFRYEFIIQHRQTIRQYAIGYVESEKVSTRPKADHYSVMFFIDDIHSWCHLTKKEFENIFFIPV
jgi:hypothetical protein